MASTKIVVTAGLAEVAAGAIAMGLGGYLAAKTDQQHYDAERAREFREVDEVPDREIAEVRDILVGYGMTPEQAAPVVDAMCKDRNRWVDFMMRFELGLEPSEPARARKSAATIGGSYIVGGLVPLVPYLVTHELRTALWVSVGSTLAALLAFGFVKARFTGINPIKGAAQTALIGGLAAGAAYAIASMFG